MNVMASRNGEVFFLLDQNGLCKHIWYDRHGRMERRIPLPFGSKWALQLLVHKKT